MHKSLLILSLVGLMGSSVSARTLSPSEALSRALSTTTESGRAHRAPVQKTPVMTVGEASAPALYVFDQGNEGYLVVSADDVAAPILGYSTTGTFDPNNIPENMRWWLGQYKLEIEAAAKASAQSYSRAAEDTRQPIEPLIKTTWDQSNPYNLQCPPYGSNLCATGCVATAMAQVMKHHQWPKKFNADFSYTLANLGTLSWKESNVEFQWNDMLDSYTRNDYTLLDPEAKAVSTLMKACGYSVNMNYGPVESGAPSVYIPGAMVNTFGYDKGTYIALRQTYSLSDWEDLLYTELASNRPVIYSGATGDDAGHCFVCDGYQKNGYFHINWGWSGLSDGYFLITALDPPSQGIGGSSSGFNLQQDAVIGLQPPVAQSKQKIQLLCSEFELTYPLANTVVLGFSPLSNYSTSDIAGFFGVRFVQNGKIVKESFTSGNPLVLSTASSYYLTAPINGCTVPDGTSDVYPVFKTTSGEIVVIQCNADQSGYARATKTGKNVTITMPEKGQYSITDMNFETPMYDGLPFMVSGNAAWTGNISVSTPIKAIFTKEKPTSKTISEMDVLAYGAPMAIEFLPDGETVTFNYMNDAIYDNDYPKNKIKLPAGKYYFSFVIDGPATISNNTIVESFRIISESVEVNYQTSPGAPETALLNWNIEDYDNVDPNDITVNLELSCTQGYFFNSVIINVLGPIKEGQEQYYPLTFRTQLLSLHAGEKQAISTKIQLSNAIPGEVYQVQFINPYTGKRYSDMAWQNITIGDYTAIDDISADAVRGVSASPNPASDYTVITTSSDIQRVDLAAVSGRFVNVPVEIEGASARVDVSALTSGLYIARVITEAGVESVKIIKK